MSAPRLVIDVHAHTHSHTAAELVGSEDGQAAEQLRWQRQMGERSVRYNADMLRGPWGHALVDIDARLQAMDRAGIAHQVVSGSPMQYYYWANPDLAKRIVAAENEAIARLCDGGHGRITGLGAVAMQHPALAVSQLTEDIRDFGFKGVMVSPIIDSHELDNPIFEEFWTCAEELRALVFIHPTGCGSGGRFSDYYLANLAGNPIDTSLALARMIFGGVLDRHTRLKILAAHGGGFLPQYIGRFDHGFRHRPEAMTCDEPPSNYLTRIYYDCIVHDAQTLQNLLRRVGAARVVVGTDYPFDMGIADPIGLLDQIVGLTVAERNAVGNENAAELLNLQGIGSG